MIDTLGMVAAAASLPDQIDSARSVAERATLPAVDPVGIAVLGMGGSGIAGDVLAQLAGPFMTVPLLVVKGYELPGCVGPDWLALAVSFSGETEEVLATASLAVERGASVVAITNGGALAGLAPNVIPVAADVAVPRAAFGALATPCLVVVDRYGLVPEDAFDLVAAAEQAAIRRDECLADDGPARALATALADRAGVFVGAGPIAAVAAYRAKCDMNENAKVPAFAAGQPEVSHNEICAMGDEFLVDMRTGLEHPKLLRRADALAAEAGAIHRIDAAGDGAYARLVDLVTVTQWASLYVAEARGVDPGPIEPISRLREALREP
jgi:glucose/mannose-6-phosphate isomerase